MVIFQFSLSLKELVPTKRNTTSPNEVIKTYICGLPENCVNTGLDPTNTGLIMFQEGSNSWRCKPYFWSVELEERFAPPGI